MAQPGARSALRDRGFTLEDRRVVFVLLALVTLAGAALRLSRFGQGMIGDELSTLWVVRGNSLTGVISTVHSDAEITPPLYFVLAWFASKLGSAPELIRLPSLLAGVALIPAVFLLARRLAGTRAGLISATVIAVMPFAINASGDGRNYAVLMLLVTLAAQALSIATERGGKGWWLLYAASGCLALYSHYTAVFVIFGIFCWALWSARESRKALLVASLLLGAGFLPWLGGYFADANSPTTAIAEALLRFSPKVAVEGIVFWSTGLPHDWVLTVRDVPGILAGCLILAGLAAALAGSLWKGVWNGPVPATSPIVLIGVLALATPVGEVIYTLFGSAVFGPRNLSASLPGLAIAIGTLIACAGPLLVLAGALVLSGYLVANFRALDADRRLPDYDPVARSIQQAAQPGDVVVDSATAVGSPTPLTPLDVYLGPGYTEFRLGLPPGDPPFLVPPGGSEEEWKKAVEAARGHTLFVVIPDVSGLREDVRDGWVKQGFVEGKLRELEAKPGFEVRHVRNVPGLMPLNLYEVTVPEKAKDPGGPGG